MRRTGITYVELTLEPAPLEESVQSTEKVMEELKKVTEGLTGAIAELVEKADLTPLMTQTVNLTRHIDKCDGQLLYLRLNMGRLKHAISDAAAPLGAVLLPALNDTVRGMTELANQVGLVLGAVVDAIVGTEAAADSTDKAAEAQKNYAAAVKVSRRTLADFDQIQRLNASSGSAAAIPSAPQETVRTLSQQLQQVVDQILKLLQPLLDMDFGPLEQSLTRLRETWERVWEQIGGALEWLWFELLMPFATWVVEELAPAVSEDLTAALELLVAALEPVFAGLGKLWEALEPVVEFIGEQAVAALDSLEQAFGQLTQVLQENGPAIESIFRGIAQAVSFVWQQVEPILQELLRGFRETFDQVSTLVSRTVAFVLQGLNGVTQFLTGVFTGDWELAWKGVKEILRSVINGVIGLLNSMLSGITSALNGVIRMANKLQFTVPSWVPELGGQTFGLKLKTVTAPQIPYLAQGAVLPANRPFLAVVGDQKHGTNVEAPLSTIQQAVLQATAGQNEAVVAALRASMEVQQEILQAVLGIHIGDDMLARAVDRYNSKMAVVYGTGRF